MTSEWNTPAVAVALLNILSQWILFGLLHRTVSRLSSRRGAMQKRLVGMVIETEAALLELHRRGTSQAGLSSEEAMQWLSDFRHSRLCARRIAQEAMLWKAPQSALTQANRIVGSLTAYKIALSDKSFPPPPGARFVAEYETRSTCEDRLNAARHILAEFVRELHS